MAKDRLRKERRLALIDSEFNRTRGGVGGVDPGQTKEGTALGEQQDGEDKERGDGESQELVITVSARKIPGEPNGIIGIQ